MLLSFAADGSALKEARVTALTGEVTLLTDPPRPVSLNDSVLVKPGQMVFGKPDAPLSDPVDFAINRFVQTSALICKFGPLAGSKAVADAIQEQHREKSENELVETNAAIFGGDATISLLDSTVKTPSPANRRGSSNQPQMQPNPELSIET